MLATLKNRWPFTSPTSIEACRPQKGRAAARSISPGMSSVRARSFAVPAGRIARGSRVLTRPWAAAFIVPSPPATMTKLASCAFCSIHGLTAFDEGLSSRTILQPFACNCIWAALPIIWPARLPAFTMRRHRWFLVIMVSRFDRPASAAGAEKGRRGGRGQSPPAVSRASQCGHIGLASWGQGAASRPRCSGHVRPRSCRLCLPRSSEITKENGHALHAVEDDHCEGV